MVISAITMVSGLASASGNPIGHVIAIILNLVNMGLKMKMSNRETESEDSRLERIINKALKEFRETSLKAEWSGYERLSELFSSNVQFVADFNENIEQEQNKGDSMTTDNIKQTMFDIVVSRLYDVLMSSTVLLGKVEYEISKRCDMDVESAVIKDTDKPEEKDIDDDKLEQTARACLGMYELYSKMNFHRESKFLQHLEIISQILSDDTKFKDLHESRRLAFAYRHLVLNVINQMKENNMNVFKPLVDPLNNGYIRYIVNYYHSYSRNYDYLKAYLDNLDFGQYSLKDVMFCTMESLTGSCSTIEPVGTVQYPNKYSKDKRFIFRSAYVPDGKTLFLRYEGDKIKKKVEIVGPGVMPTMYYGPKSSVSPIEEVSVSESEAIFGEVQVRYDNGATLDEAGQPKKEVKRLDRLLRICVNEKGATEEKVMPLHKAVCTDRQESRFPNSIDMAVLETEFSWQKNYISLGSNETDLAIIAEGEVKIKDTTYKMIWGPFFSPFKMALGCGSINWNKISTYRYNSLGSDEIVNKIQDPKLCYDDNLLCQPEMIDKSFFVTICKQPEMKGHCHDIPLIKGRDSKVFDLKYLGVRIIDPLNKDITDVQSYNEKIDDCVWTTRVSGPKVYRERNNWVNLLESMKIPMGLKVFLYTDYGSRGDVFGPYTGPITVDKIDGNDDKSTIIKSIKIYGVWNSLQKEFIVP